MTSSALPPANLADPGWATFYDWLAAILSLAGRLGALWFYPMIPRDRRDALLERIRAAEALARRLLFERALELLKTLPWPGRTRKPVPPERRGPRIIALDVRPPPPPPKPSSRPELPGPRILSLDAPMPPRPEPPERIPVAAPFCFFEPPLAARAPHDPFAGPMFVFLAETPAPPHAGPGALFLAPPPPPPPPRPSLQGLTYEEFAALYVNGLAGWQQPSLLAPIVCARALALRAETLWRIAEHPDRYARRFAFALLRRVAAETPFTVFRPPDRLNPRAIGAKAIETAARGPFAAAPNSS